MHHITVWLRWIDVSQVFSHGLAGACHDVAVQETSIKKVLQHNRNTTDSVNICHVVLAAWLCVCNVRHFVSDAVEVFQLQIDTCFMRNRQQVEHCVCASAECTQDCNRVLKCLLRHDVARTNTKAQQVDNSRTSATRIIFT